MPVSPGQVIRVVAKMRQAASDLLNVFEAFHTGVSVVADLDVMDDVATWLEALYTVLQPLMSDTLTFETYEVVNITTDTLIGEAAWPTLTAGGDVTTPSPMQCAALVRFPSNYMGSQGRKFIPGLTEGELGSNGLLTPAWQTALASFGLLVLSGLNIDGQLFLVGKDNVDKARFSTWQSYVVNDRAATQRRRVPGVGS